MLDLKCLCSDIDLMVECLVSCGFKLDVEVFNVFEEKCKVL